MAALEDVSLKYVHDNINEIIKVPIDMGCINKVLMVKLAQLFTLDDMAKIQDPRDKIQSRLYLHKLSDTLSPPAAPQSAPTTAVRATIQAADPSAAPAILHCCTLCRQVYAQAEERHLRCPKARIEVGFCGEVVAVHRRDTKFNPNDYIASLRLTGLSWKEVFWRIWGITHHFTCTTCSQVIAYADFTSCRKHSSNAIYTEGSGKGSYPCCGSVEYRFDPFGAGKTGCRMYDHCPHPDNNPTTATFKTNSSMILWPHTIDLSPEAPSSLDLFNESLSKILADTQLSKGGYRNEEGENSDDDVRQGWIFEVLEKEDREGRPGSGGISRPSSAPADSGKGSAKKAPHIQKDESSARMTDIINQVIKLRRKEGQMM
ncbi:hypothetical protein HDV00_001417 [Rhizophlyctis rosea]|nr:hypothetical protein HDV00_001417 [Rhizophlyctis rosea]